MAACSCAVRQRESVQWKNSLQRSIWRLEEKRSNVLIVGLNGEIFCTFCFWTLRKSKMKTESVWSQTAGGDDVGETTRSESFAQDELNHWAADSSMLLFRLKLSCSDRHATVKQFRVYLRRRSDVLKVQYKIILVKTFEHAKDLFICRTPKTSSLSAVLWLAARLTELTC